ncbi:MAG: hypothetical protein WC325_08515 [Candidatus Bathyarchaeia archaeon]|jgi:hypothetical protein
MVRKNVIQRKLSKLLGDRKGTAEIVGSVMFLVILLFVFTNVYLWHDSATREMNTVLAEKMNSPITVTVDGAGTGLNVTNNGGFEVGLERLWLVTDSGHYYAELGQFNVRIAAGERIHLLFTTGTANSDGTVKAIMNGDTVLVYYSVDSSVVCKVLTTLGNMAACTF